MYSARITRANPAAFIFLIDRSGSMDEKTEFAGTPMTKAEAVAMVTNMLIRELIHRCRREEGIMDYFDIAAIGYSDTEARMLLGNRDAFAKPSALAVMSCRRRSITRERVLPNGTSTVVSEQLPYWIEPLAEGSTPMRSALEQALVLTSKWCRRSANRASYPPTIFNITDGEASDGDEAILCELAEEIKSLGTDDGKALLININISSDAGRTLFFPGSKNELPVSRYADMLFDMSSRMPEEYDAAIRQLRPDAKPPYRGMSLNASPADIIAMMNIGSRSVTRIL